MDYITLFFKLTSPSDLATSFHSLQGFLLQSFISSKHEILKFKEVIAKQELVEEFFLLRLEASLKEFY